MYKTLIQLVLFLILILIFFFITDKYFYNEDKDNELKNSTSINKETQILTYTPFIHIEEKKINNEILNLTYEKFDTIGNKYLIKAKKGMLDSKKQHLINMHMVEASLIYLNNEKLIINSNEAIFNKKNFKTTFSKNVKLVYQEQTLESDYLDLFIDKNIAIFRDNVKYYNQNIEAFADVVNINLLTKEIDIKSKNKKKIRIKNNN